MSQHPENRFIMETEIFNLEKKYWDAMANQDYETVKSLTKFPCIVAGKQGIMKVDETAYKKMFEQGSGKAIQIKQITNEEITQEDSCAWIAYLIEMDYNGTLMKCVCTSTWVKEHNKWLCAMHTECDFQEKSA